MVELLRANKLTGWRRHFPIEGKPDFVWAKYKIALFIDGCFWHGCPKCRQRPVNNAEYWDWKLERNKRRDRAVSKELAASGWSVVRIWECQVSSKRSVTRICKAITNGQEMRRAARC